MKSVALLTISFLLLGVIPFASASLPQVKLPSGFTLSVPAGVKAHLGDKWVYPQTVSMTITQWNVSNWINYTVPGAGVQQVYYGTQPTAVYIDGSHHAVGDGWTYVADIATVTVAASAVCLYYATLSGPGSPSPGPTIGPQIGSSQAVHFIVSMDNLAVQNCQVKLYLNATGEYLQSGMTDSAGTVDFSLHSGVYHYEALYRDKKVMGDWMHIEEDTIRIVFNGTGPSGISYLDKSRVPMYAAGAVIIVVAVFAVFAVKKKVVG